MTEYAQGCRKAFIVLASPQAAVTAAARRRVRGLPLVATGIAPRSPLHPLQQRLQTHRRIADAFARDMS